MLAGGGLIGAGCRRARLQLLQLADVVAGILDDPLRAVPQQVLEQVERLVGDAPERGPAAVARGGRGRAPELHSRFEKARARRLGRGGWEGAHQSEAPICVFLQMRAMTWKEGARKG